MILRFEKRRTIIILISIILLSGIFLGALKILNERDFLIAVEEFKKLTTAEQDETIKKLSAEGIDFRKIYTLVAESYSSGHPEKHVLAHTLGEAAVRKHGLSGFAMCDSLLSYGCYHGAALAAARVYGYDPNLGKKLWESCKAGANFPGDCLHGLGHAVMVIERYDLIRAYEECEAIFSEEDEREIKAFWCKDGVSMENVERSLAEEGLPPYGDENNLYYPCDSLPARHQPICYRDHVSYLKNQLSFSKKQVSNFCLTLPNESARGCFDMTGSLVDRSSPAKDVADFCPEGAYMKDCLMGAVSALSMERLYAEAESVCEIFPEEERQECEGRIRSVRGSLEVPKKNR